MAHRPHVVIIGAGFGGIEAARLLSRSPVDITLIDRHNYHCFQPLLYQVATAALSPADIAWPIRGIFRGYPNITVLMANVTGIDAKARIVKTSEADIFYDYCIVATGSTHSYFGHDEWAETAPGLKEIDDATAIRRNMLLAFERAEVSNDETERRSLLTFVVVGAGPTGVEMAGSIAEVAREAIPHDFRRIDTYSARVILVEAGPRILPSLPDSLSGYAHRALEKIGIEIMSNTRVTGCDVRGVDTDRGRIDAGTVVWAAGVVASPAARWLGARADRAGRAIVESDLSVAGHDGVFVIGDTAAILDKTGEQIPGIAPAAKQMGQYAAKVIAARVANGPVPKPFRYRHAGNLATIGRKAAVVQLDYMNLKGFVGWLFWSIAHIYYLIGVRNRVVVAVSWMWSYFTFQRGARLITGIAAADRRFSKVTPYMTADVADLTPEPIREAV